MRKTKIFSLFVASFLFFYSCTSTPELKPPTETEKTPEIITENNQKTEAETPQITENSPTEKPAIEQKKTESDSITLLFTGDLMAHSVNYQITSYSKIYRDVKFLLDRSDLTFANLEAPVDTTKNESSYPNFNMNQEYVEAAVDAGFDVFSLCNNHSNDQGLDGIKETIKTAENITKKYCELGRNVYFSGLKEKTTDSYSYNVIEKNGWKILFLPITEILNRPDYSKYINYTGVSENDRKIFVEYVKKLREENPCDLFVLSLHANEPEYTRNVTESQKKYYLELLDAGVDILWCNHAHIIKDRQFIFDSENGNQKMIMYANGNVISGQRTKPDFNAKNPDYERDNTGDGLFYFLTLKKNDLTGQIQIVKGEPFFVTTYINTAYEFVLKPMNEEFIDYLYDVPRKNWAEYIKKRIIINNRETKDLITWQ